MAYGWWLGQAGDNVCAAFLVAISQPSYADTRKQIDLSAKIPFKCLAELVEDKKAKKRKRLAIIAECNSAHKIRIYVDAHHTRRQSSSKRRQIFVRLGKDIAPVINGAADFTYEAVQRRQQSLRFFDNASGKRRPYDPKVVQIALQPYSRDKP